MKLPRVALLLLLLCPALAPADEGPDALDRREAELGAKWNEAESAGDRFAAGIDLVQFLSERGRAQADPKALARAERMLRLVRAEIPSIAAAPDRRDAAWEQDVAAYYELLIEGSRVLLLSPEDPIRRRRLLAVAEAAKGRAFLTWPELEADFTLLRIRALDLAGSHVEADACFDSLLDLLAVLSHCEGDEAVPGACVHVLECTVFLATFRFDIGDPEKLERLLEPMRRILATISALDEPWARDLEDRICRQWNRVLNLSSCFPVRPSAFIRDSDDPRRVRQLLRAEVRTARRFRWPPWERDAWLGLARSYEEQARLPEALFARIQADRVRGLRPIPFAADVERIAERALAAGDRGISRLLLSRGADRLAERIGAGRSLPEDPARLARMRDRLGK